jgi:hypothetical protein
LANRGFHKVIKKSKQKGGDNVADEYPDNTKQEDVLDRLLRIPVENLENRIKELESEITERELIREKILKNMNNETSKLQEKAEQSQYPIFKELTLKSRIALENQMINLEKRKAQTIEACFQDIMKLKKELRKTKEKLKHEKEKQRLILE